MQIQIISTLFAVWNKKTSKLPFQLRLRFRVFYSGSWSGETIYRIFLPFKTNSRVYFPVDPAQENAQRFQTFLANDREKYTSGIPGVYRTPLYYILLNPSESWLSRFMLSLNCALPLCTDYDVTPQGKKEGKKEGKTTSTILELLLLKCVAEHSSWRNFNKLINHIGNKFNIHMNYLHWLLYIFQWNFSSENLEVYKDNIHSWSSHQQCVDIVTRHCVTFGSFRFNECLLVFLCA